MILSAILNVTPENTIQFISMIMAIAGLWFAMKARHDKERERVNTKIDEKADKGYVDQQDRSLHKRIDEIRSDNKAQHADLKQDMKDGFQTVKELLLDKTK